VLEVELLIGPHNKLFLAKNVWMLGEDDDDTNSEGQIPGAHWWYRRKEAHFLSGADTTPARETSPNFRGN
jgi:hypothetical protein